MAFQSLIGTLAAAIVGDAGQLRGGSFQSLIGTLAALGVGAGLGSRVHVSIPHRYSSSAHEAASAPRHEGVSIPHRYSSSDEFVLLHGDWVEQFQSLIGTLAACASASSMPGPTGFNPS